MRSLRTKTKDLTVSLAASSMFDVIILVETWLTDCISSSELGLSNYNVYRYDRSINTNKSSRGGGVLIAVKKNIICSRLSPIIEQFFLHVNVSNISILLGAVYIPPGSSPFLYHDHRLSVDALTYSRDYSQIYIVSDFNLSSIEWHSSSPSVITPSSSSISPALRFALTLVQCYNSCGLSQHNLIRNFLWSHA